MAALPARTRRQLTRVWSALHEDPRPTGSVKLAGTELWRIRVGDYRVIYEVRDAILVVLVIKVGHRREVYRAR